MILTLSITILIESSILVVFSHWRKKPLLHLFLSSILANSFTQLILWGALNIFPLYYWTTLITTEICIVGIESLIMLVYRPNQLRPGEAVLLSLVMNLASFTIGLFLPV
jgi:hypothetical protein